MIKTADMVITNIKVQSHHRITLEVCFLYFTQIAELLQSLLVAEILGCVLLVEITHSLRSIENVMHLLKSCLQVHLQKQKQKEYEEADLSFFPLNN